MQKSIKNIVLSVISASAGIIFFVLALMLLFFAGKKGYAFGEAVFLEKPASAGLGSNILVSVEKDMDARKLADYFEKKGLVEDDMVFYVQILLSDYNKKFVPGQYMLNTNMKPTEMLQKICSGEFYVDPASLLPADEVQENENDGAISEKQSEESNE